MDRQLVEYTDKVTKLYANLNEAIVTNNENKRQLIKDALCLRGLPEKPKIREKCERCSNWNIECRHIQKWYIDKQKEKLNKFNDVFGDAHDLTIKIKDLANKEKLNL